ncbi:DUF3310 domain-containing protein [Staphylococcus argensis]|uniref:DUF3310 domain-containing protein n=1 Tax=Staphylococcus argensis TaxID=1607738 RepID=A0A2K4FDN8_9STAP|nr:DUF3310 domain-containing protein [Staphylococcus argensis]MCY6991218.1 DUF3310 domain-containing protein [Staphylococcus argensis]POA09470.1 hypothetical protein CD039_01550 [Staphylococcus argensis]
MLKKAKISELKPNDKIVYYGLNEEPRLLKGLKAKVLEVFEDRILSTDIAVIEFENGYREEINDSDYFDLIKTNDLQQRKRHQMNQVPNHYQGTDGIDVIEFCRQQFTHDELVGALKFNIIKYATRIARKNQDVEDIEKIGVYQRRLKEVLADE